MEGVCMEIESWSVSQVLSWLISTNDGKFEELVPIFREHQIYGDALLSLNNDILRDELRHALLKAIQNLKQSYKSRQELQSKLKNVKFNMNHINNHNNHHHHHQSHRRYYGVHQQQYGQYGKSHRKASMSSVCSKASVQSQTFTVGDLVKDTSDTQIHGIDDNWENLNTMGKYGVVDASEYLKQAKLIVKAVTGTTIKLTRKSSDDNDLNVYKSGYFEFENNIPNWNDIMSQSAIRYEWDMDHLKWNKSYISVKISGKPFSRGSLRVSYYCLDLTDTNNINNVNNMDKRHSNHQKGSPSAKSFKSSKSSKSLKSDNISSLKGLYSKSNGNLKQIQNEKIAIKQSNAQNLVKRDVSYESMSVPAEVALGRHHDVHRQHTDDLVFPYLSPSVPEAEDEKIESSQSPIDHRQTVQHEEKSKDEEDENIIANHNDNHHDHKLQQENEENEEKSIPSLPSRMEESQTFTATISTKTNLQKDDLLARLLGFENRYGGNLIVAKQSIDLTESVQTYFNDVRTQSVAQLFANEYNKYNPPKKVAFIKASVIQLLESDNEQFFCVEDYLHGAYMKHLDNYGGDEGIRNTPSAFAHFTYEASQHRLLVCDIQGVGDLYTDPQIHTADGKGFGKGNLGIDGMIKFLQTHQCNAICRHLRLDIVNSIIKINGTRPAKMYMDKQNIKIIDHIDKLNSEEYHKIPHIPINTLNDYYLNQIYNIKHQSICEHDPHFNENTNGSNKLDHDDLDELMMSDEPNSVNTRYSRHRSSENDYNPLTPLINGSDSEDTKCSFCNCTIL